MSSHHRANSPYIVLLTVLMTLVVIFTLFYQQ